ncbi:DUF2326 domain-containing protein [Listeria seeligeri]|uniref:DUF2326 domain-containing protein n=2 Tax=Listeria seeligeri TaxID=1640 RepID=UPI0016277064|nr:DUF2326 domain-containing protein [Listeria seeligeri]MBC2071390.1 DUF2326 domain-containing protein [Listeria seeligeri]MBC2087311.1 DUF2326 domain-containing protein [Listeria seeligeri]MBF2354794.1 DUF2326 domain-containing protein [Listeria seeligeri]MBF2591477.1 DUF2326 domain-containing protein [Listeria seeligeri]MBF2653049.1 DUF2326 domain-containing protein [Listeria seeligeri]
MLKMIECEKFSSRAIFFNEGLNIIAGDEVASNSIGKTTMLMIIDFIFGGGDYLTKNSDTVKHLGHHEFCFRFLFNKQDYFFRRGTKTPGIIYICDEKYRVLEGKNLSEYLKWLQNKYDCELDGLSFRGIVSRFFRIYGRANLDERTPLKSYENEKMVDSIIDLIKLFDKYRLISSYQQKVSELDNRKKIVNKAEKVAIIDSAVNKAAYKRNQKAIQHLSEEIEVLKQNIMTHSMGKEALLSDEILELQNQKNKLVISRNKQRNRLRKNKENIALKKSRIFDDIDQLESFFPEVDKSRINDIEQFHLKLTDILKDELNSSKRELEAGIRKIDQEIDALDLELSRLLEVDSAPKYSVSRLIELSAAMKNYEELNKRYDDKKKLKEELSIRRDELVELKKASTDEITQQINQQMLLMFNSMYTDKFNPPRFEIHEKAYSLKTDNDTGTGTAFVSLILFDLSILKLTKLPSLVHDLPLLKNIDNDAMEQIIKLYASNEKQIFIAIDKIESYSKATSKLILKNRVLQLNKGKNLFIESWKDKN